MMTHSNQGVLWTTCANVLGNTFCCVLIDESVCDAIDNMEYPEWIIVPNNEM